MEQFLFTFFALALAFVGMAMGVIFSNKELKGSCGGISNIPGMKSDCSCANPCEKRKAKMAKEQAEDELGSQPEYAKINIDKLSSNK